MPAQNMATIPPSRTTARVYIIDTTFEANVPTEHFIGPPIKGFDSLQLVAYSFLIVDHDHMGNERKIIFDLGSPKDIEGDLPPAVAQMIQGMGGNVAVGKYVSDILTEDGDSMESIEAIIWRQVHAST
ncbi:metallo-beta-lactamase superfamily [Fusarium albosuccineum]|uniref:Metallo-beta-lactamase superfamily n=1 Tax=Fusarium albosuccineum TaxID=1237068 RepID=A0A8H4L3V6_9HYPO|nr:metallo-beta-lactamase superfamily [Fusarium albosuccineum]